MMSFHNNLVFGGNRAGYNQFFPQNYHITIAHSVRDVKKHDEEFIIQWLSKLNPDRSENKTYLFPTSVSSTRKSIKEVLELCEKIKESRNFLNENVSSLTEDDWDCRIAQIEEWKREITKKGILDDEVMYDVLKRKLKKRASKRARLKRKRDEAKIIKEENKRYTIQKNKDIDCALNKMKEELERKKKDEELKITTDNVLKDVTKRKAAGKNYLAMLDALTKLRVAREKSAIGRGEKINQKDAIDFATNIEKLKEMWNYALDQYAIEENNLIMNLENSNEDTTIEPASSSQLKDNTCDVGSLWQTVLFGGDNLLPQRNFNGNIHQFINMRRQWDKYVSRDDNNSEIPIGWVIPPENTSDHWKKYLV